MSSKALHIEKADKGPPHDFHLRNCPCGVIAAILRKRSSRDTKLRILGELPHQEDHVIGFKGDVCVEISHDLEFR